MNTDLKRRPSFKAPEFWLLMTTLACGTAGVPPVTAVGLCTLGLCLSALPKYVKLWPKVPPQKRGMWFRIVALSVLNCAGAGAAVYMIGGLMSVLVFS